MNAAPATRGTSRPPARGASRSGGPRTVARRGSPRRPSAGPRRPPRSSGRRPAPRRAPISHEVAVARLDGRTELCAQARGDVLHRPQRPWGGQGIAVARQHARAPAGTEEWKALTSEVFPTPASPETSTTDPWPYSADRAAEAIARSSSLRSRSRAFIPSPRDQHHGPKGIGDRFAEGAPASGRRCG